MKAIFTAAALADLDEILAYTSENYPALAGRLERRIRDVVAHIEEWPLNARMLNGQPDVRIVPLLRYPYKIFYRIADGRIDILHIHHTAREPWQPG